jgi:hypothetical protein
MAALGVGYFAGGKVDWGGAVIAAVSAGGVASHVGS